MKYYVNVFFVLFFKRDTNKRISIEEARDIYEKAEKLEQAFAEHFTAVIQEESFEEIYDKCKEVIAEQAGPFVWVSHFKQKKNPFET